MGGRPPETTDAEILQIFVESPDPVLDTTEVADALGYSNPGTFKRLDSLREEGLLGSKLLGGEGSEGVRAWWITAAGESFLEGDDGDDGERLSGTQ